jgi:hypothetical protein
MTLAVTVILLVLGATAVVAIAGYLVDRSTARLERKE